MKLSKRINVSKKLLLLLMLSGPMILGSFRSCTIVEQDMQAVIYTVERFDAEANKILDSYREAVGADVAVLAVYDSDFGYRIIVAESLSSGESISTGRSRRSKRTAGYIDIYETIKDERSYFSAVEDIPAGSFKNDLQKAGRTFVVASPIYNSSGYLVGYLGSSWSEDSRPSDRYIIEKSELAAAELSRLSGIFG